MGRRKVLLVEVNEVTWNLIDPLIEQGRLPTFARLKREGAWASPMSDDLPPQLDPGCHDPKGMMMLYGAGIRRGTPIGDSTNLDIAPTLLTLLGLPVPEYMKGRVLREAFDEIPAN